MHPILWFFWGFFIGFNLVSIAMLILLDDPTKDAPDAFLEAFRNKRDPL